MTNCIFVGVRSIAEANAALVAVERFREAQAGTQIEDPHAPSALDGGRVLRILNALSWRKLPSDYGRLFRVLLDAPEGQPVKIDALAEAISASSVGRVDTMTQKLTGRIKKFATAEELASVRRPFNLIITATYEKDAPAFQLTDEGREAVQRFLGR